MRKTAKVTIDGNADSRDYGKTFLLTEMSAEDLESWSIRALGAMQRAGMEISDDELGAGIIAMAARGLKALLAAPYDEVRPLMAEMMACVQIVMPGTPAGRPLMSEDIEEVSTRVRLRDEVFKLHVGFSIATALLTAVALSQATPSEESSNTPTSQAPSALSSQAA